MFSNARKLLISRLHATQVLFYSYIRISKRCANIIALIVATSQHVFISFFKVVYSIFIIYFRYILKLFLTKLAILWINGLYYFFGSFFRTDMSHGVDMDCLSDFIHLQKRSLVFIISVWLEYVRNNYNNKIHNKTTTKHLFSH